MLYLFFFITFIVAAGSEDDAQKFFEQVNEQIKNGEISQGDSKKLMDQAMQLLKNAGISQGDIKNLKDQANQHIKNGKISPGDLKNLMDQVMQLLKDSVNGGNMVQISSMGLFMTVLAIFNR